MVDIAWQWGIQVSRKMTGLLSKSGSKMVKEAGSRLS